MDSFGEHFSKLQEAASVYDQRLATLSITNSMYETNGFVTGINLQRAPGSSASGLNTRTGSLLVLKLNNLNANVNRIYAHLVGMVLV